MALNYSLDEGLSGSPKLGLIVLSTDETLESEARQVFAGREATLLHARIQAEPDVTPAALALMEERLPSVASLLPSGLSVIGYACTSAATVIGPETVEKILQKQHADASVTNPISAVIAALHAVKAKRLALVTPYVKEVTAPMKALLERNGFTTTSEGAFEQSDDQTVARITQASTLAAILDVANSDCDAVFVSCTNLRSLGILEQAEQALGRPVISSNQALLWHMLKLSNTPAIGWGPGQLFQL